MRIMTKLIFIIIVVLALGVPSAVATPPAAADDDRAIVIVFKDGRQQNFRLSEIARIEFSSPAGMASTSTSGHAHFLGVWKVGVGGGLPGTFLITLKPNGVAEKTMGSKHGKWTLVNGEARCKWDDGWTDVIRKAGSKWEKAAYSPVTSLDDKPSSVAEAVYTEPN